MNFNQGKGEAGVLRLYISGQTTKSVRALANLQRINDIYLKGKYRIDIYDLALDPQKVKQDQIIAVPCLVRQYPPPKTKILGDLSNTEQVLAALDEADRIYRTIVEEMMEGYVTLDKDGTILFCNKAFSDMIKNTTEQIIGSSIINMVSLADGEEIASYLSKRQLKLRKEMSLSSDSKDTIPVLSSASRIDADGNELVCMLFTDMSAQKDAETALRNKEETIARMAYFDALTGLPNRALFMDRLGNAIRNAKRSGNGLAVIFIDLDDFKRVNDTMGHWAGDLLLKEVGDRIQRSVRDSDTLSRMGGDEFAVLIPSNKDAKEADIVGSRIIQAVRNRPFEINNVPHILTASIGIAIFPNNGRSDDELLKNADIAMYKSKYQTKAQGKNQCCFFDDFMQAEIEKKILLEMNLREALNNNELAVFFQPLFEVNSGAIHGMEALMRWHSNRLGDVPPDIFIPMAEENQLILQYGNWILRYACLKNKEWQDKGLPKIPIAVNISSKELEQDCFVNNVSDILRETGLKPCYLELEITESIMIKGKEEAIAKLKLLRELGVGISLDDFGTGYSSLNYLNRLPLSMLKIDRSFIATLQQDKSAVKLVRAIISLAHRLGLKVVAEGVENVGQVNILAKSRCDLLQGFFYSPPVDEITAEAALNELKKRPL